MSLKQTNIFELHLFKKKEKKKKKRKEMHCMHSSPNQQVVQTKAIHSSQKLIYRNRAISLFQM